MRIQLCAGQHTLKDLVRLGAQTYITDLGSPRLAISHLSAKASLSEVVLVATGVLLGLGAQLGAVGNAVS